MQTKIWESLVVFDNLITADNIEFCDVPATIPIVMDSLVRKNWNNQLKDKQRQLTENGLITTIKPYDSDNSQKPLNALYQDKHPVMWPGPVVTLGGVKSVGSKIRLLVSQSSFPFIKGIQDPRIAKLYEDQNISKPRPALGICTFSETSDGYLVLTVRGEKTTMYPGRFYGQGGNPLYASTDPVAHQVDEIEDEILIKPSEYDHSQFRFSGIIVDTDQLPNKPDLVGWIPVNLTAQIIKERVNQRPLNVRPNDAVDVTFAPTEPEKLHDYLVTTELYSFDPPAHGGLVLYGYHKFGKEWASKLIKKLNSLP